LHFKPVNISGLDGFDYAFETTGTMDSGEQVRQTLRQVLLEGRDELYVLNAGALSPTYEKELGVVDRFLNSFASE
jgi:hypothetical protein